MSVKIKQTAIKMKTKLLIITLVILVIFCGCEAHKQVYITVYDQVSKRPIDSMHVVIKAGKYGDYSKSGTEGYTDSTGRFSASFMIGCSFGCYDVFVGFQKKGYAPLIEFNPKDSLIVYLQPLI